VIRKESFNELRKTIDGRSRCYLSLRQHHGGANAEIQTEAAYGEADYDNIPGGQTDADAASRR
jgi:hypothetical protein